ncbi:MAG: hypothetical protein ACLVEO_05910 [Lachnospiraceae bacterium]
MKKKKKIKTINLPTYSTTGRNITPGEETEKETDPFDGWDCCWDRLCSLHSAIFLYNIKSGC